jgi:glycosyltransferase involved in cell wall biosynthesis
MSPRVSVIIPTHNRADTVCDAVDSVLLQACREVEVIVVDDASVDETPRVLERYGDRIRYLRRSTNGGAAAARNDGIRASSGEFVAFLDSDDVYLRDRLQKPVDVLAAAPEFGGAYADMQITTPGRMATSSYLSLSGHCTSGWVFRQQLVRGALHTNTVTVRRKCLDEVGLFDESLRRCQDIHLWLRLTHHCRFVYVPGVAALWRVQPSSLAESARVSGYRWQALLKTLDDISDLSAEERVLIRVQAVAAIAMHMAALISAGDPAQARAVRSIARSVMSELPARDRLMAQALLVARHHRMLPVAGAARWARALTRRAQYALQKAYIHSVGDSSI